MLKRTFTASVCRLFYALTALSFGTPAFAEQTRTVLLTIAGTVEVSKSGGTAWTPGQTNQLLQVRDRLRTGRNSRATVQLSDASILRVNQLTTLEIQNPTNNTRSPLLELKSGATYFFNRDKPMETQFRTPTASGAVRGTEFYLAVNEQGETKVTLLDGEVDLNNQLGSVRLKSGEEGNVQAGLPPRKSPALNASSVIQWTLYYPAVLDLADVDLPAESTLAPSLAAYRSGDLLRALSQLPQGQQPSDVSEKIYVAALLLSVGQVQEAEKLLPTGGSEKTMRLATALRELIAVVQGHALPHTGQRQLATEYLAGSYAEQANGHLDKALAMAYLATAKSPKYAFAHARVAELQFSFGRIGEASRALEQSLQLAPKNAQALALAGFLANAQNRRGDASKYFEDSIAVDGSLGNAWLGRGLTRIREGHSEEGRRDLQVAAAVEPNRSLLRSYLGKAFSNAGDQGHAEKELKLARDLDSNDPTPWLYAALFNQQRNEINAAVTNLERSQELNDNRSIFRSKFLLDQDKAVRSANLASIYRDAGMTDVSVREALRAVNSDYANYSAHRFLSEAYDELRDPKQINLRFETPWLSEMLIANLLAPVGGGSLSQNISQQEYSRLFEGNRLGVSSRTEYFSSGDWIQSASQFGTWENSSYALDVYYNAQNGQRPNNDFQDLFFSARVKQEFTPADSLYLELTYERRKSGDVLQYYDQGRASLTQRIGEEQFPNVYAGFHHQWSPGVHTLVLASRLDDVLTVNDSAPTLLFLREVGGVVTSVRNPSLFTLDYQRKLEAYSAEVQQIWELPSHTLILGGRYQNGTVETTNSIVRITGPVFTPQVNADLWRFSLYAYDQWRILDPLQLTLGVSYDKLHFPLNVDTPPVSTGEKEKEQLSPKVGLIWTPERNTQVRGSFTRSLGGVFFDNSVRLEPTQVGGFNQALRSVAPESVVGIVPGTRFETYALGIDHKFASRTYLGLEGEWLSSSADRTVGVLKNSTFFPVPDRPSSTHQKIDFEEQTLLITLNQLISDEWSVGARYRLSHANLDGRFTEVPPRAPGASGINQDNQATLQQLNLYANYNLRCGFFAQVNALWNAQSNRGYTPDEPGDDFWHFNAFLGYRFPNRHAEVRLGVLNIGDRDYRLNPVNYYLELPRERTFTASLKINF